MVGYVVKRLAQAVAVMAGVVLLTFVLARLVPGDPAVAYAGPKATPEELDAVRAEFGLDQPLYRQLIDYVSGVLRGDWGVALHTKEPVLDDLVRVVPQTLVLVVLALLVAAAVGIPLGALAAAHRGRLADLLSKVFAILVVSMPIFWLAILAQTLISGQLGWLPVAGQYDFALDDVHPLYHVTGVPVLDALLTGNWPVFGSALQHLVLPVLVAAAYPLGACAMITRASLLENLGEEHVRMVQALGFSQRSVLTRFAMRPALNPILSLLALTFAYSLVNSFLVESIFNWPGVGRYTIASIEELDVPAIVGVTMFVALTYALLNLLVDLAQMIIDPRSRA